MKNDSIILHDDEYEENLHNMFIKDKRKNLSDIIDDHSLKDKSTSLEKDKKTTSVCSKSSSKSLSSFKNHSNENFALFYEYLIQINCQCPIPGVILEVNDDEFPGWDMEDLEKFLNEIGEVQYFRGSTSNKKIIIIFYKFRHALLAINYFNNNDNFKEAGKDMFLIDWINFDPSCEETKFSKCYSDFPKIIENQINSIYQTYTEQLKLNYLINNNIDSNQQNQDSLSFLSKQHAYSSILCQNDLNLLNNQDSFELSNQNYNNNFNLISDSLSSYNTCNYNSMPNFNNLNNMTLMNYGCNNNQNNMNSFGNNLLKSGKYTCKFELLIENEPEFLISRKIIGPKGCNMKKILDDCEEGENPDIFDLKLRLRGKDSGFKEGPLNCESNEPLHLCISSRSWDIYSKACKLVNNLLSNIGDDYKKFCQKKNRKIIKSIFVKKDEGISTNNS